MEDEVKHLSVDIESNMRERSGGEKWVKFTSEQNIFYETKKILLLIDCNEWISIKKFFYWNPQWTEISETGSENKKPT